MKEAYRAVGMTDEATVRFNLVICEWRINGMIQFSNTLYMVCYVTLCILLLLFSFSFLLTRLSSYLLPLFSPSLLPFFPPISPRPRVVWRASQGRGNRTCKDGGTLLNRISWPSKAIGKGKHRQYMTVSCPPRYPLIYQVHLNNLLTCINHINKYKQTINT